MIETCTTRRMLLLIAVLLVSSTVVLLFEEYVEDSELEASRKLRQQGKLVFPRDDPKNPTSVTDTTQCSAESLKVVEECLPCTSFEMKALQSSYCKDTGYYTKFICEATNQTVFAACYAKQMKSFVRFNLFAAMSITWSAILYTFVSWRRKVMERRSYMRVSQFVT